MTFIDFKMYQYVSKKPEQWQDELLFVTRTFTEQYGPTPLLRIGGDTPATAIAAWQAEFPDSDVIVDDKTGMRGCFMLAIPPRKRKPKPIAPDPAKEVPTSTKSGMLDSPLAKLFQRTLFGK